VTCVRQSCERPRHKDAELCLPHVRVAARESKDLVALHNPGATEERLAEIKEVAGEGDLDERCRRILGAFGKGWFGFEYEIPKFYCSWCGKELDKDKSYCSQACGNRYRYESRKLA